MQVNSVNSVNFKSNYDFKSDNDVQEMINAARTLENMLPDKYIKETDGNGNETKKKSAVGTALSVLGTAFISFALSKKLLNNSSEGIKKLMGNEKVQSALTNAKEFVNKNSNKLLEKIKGNGKLNSVLENIKSSKLTNLAEKIANNVKSGVSKVGAKNVLAGIGGVAGATYISKVDSNNDGVADIAQKGVNAYKGAVEQLGVIGDAINALS